MLTSKQWTFSDGQDVAATAISTNVYTNGPTEGTNTVDLGAGMQLHGLVQVGDDVTASGSATVNIQFVSATDNALSSGVRVHWETGAIAKAALVAGWETTFKLPVSGGTAGAYQDFVGFNYVVASGPLTGTGGQFRALVTAAHPDANLTPFESGQNWHS